MKIVYQFLFIVILSYILELFMPWWSIAIAAFAGGLILRSQVNFLTGFIAIALLWIIKAALIDHASASPLADKVAAIFTLPNKFLLMTLMATIGGLVGGFSCLSGALLKRNV